MHMSIKSFFVKLGAIKEMYWRGLTMKMSLDNAQGDRLATISSIGKIPELLDFGRNYKPDPGKKGNWDQTIHPCAVQHKINTNSFGTKNMDCDDHAVYWCAMILKNKLADKVWFTKIVWENSGHAFCVYQKDNEYFWGDYGYPVRCDSKTDYVKKVSATYGEIRVRNSVMFNVEFDPETDSIKLRDPEVILPD